MPVRASPAHQATRAGRRSVSPGPPARDDFITQAYEVLKEGEATTLMRKST